MKAKTERSGNGRQDQENDDHLKTSRANFYQIFGLVWTASPGGTLLMAALAFAAGLIPPGLAWTQKLLIDRIVGLVGSDVVSPWNGMLTLLPLLIVILLLLLSGSIITQGNLLTEKSLRNRLRYHINSLIIQRALELDLSYFENAQYYDLLQNAREEADMRALNIVLQTSKAVQQTITIVAFLLLLTRFSPWLIAIMLFATLPSFGLQSKYSQLSFRLLNNRSPERRRMKYFEDLLTMDRYVKEVKLFDLGQTLFSRYTTHFWALFLEDLQVAWRQSIVSVVWSAIGLIGFLVSMAWIIYRTIAATITFGDGILYLEAFRQSHLMVQAMLATIINLTENSLFIGNIFTFLALKPQTAPVSNPHSVPMKMKQGIEFRDVSFRYPGNEAWALRHVNLVIPPGEKLALVGLNGSGKTTLVKLLAGFYPSTEGDILIDGVSLSQYDLAAWRRKIGVIFQDFVRYQFSAAENIGVGKIEMLENRSHIIAAAQKGGADDMITSLPSGYDTLLGRWFAEGHELSLGQWQKIALSRAFMRDSEIVILDEPTAALDAEQEYRIFQLFHELTADKLAILISHRFSTVRMADRIAVVEDGAITELGSHKDLMRLDGAYARLFNIQALGYQ